MTSSLVDSGRIDLVEVNPPNWTLQIAGSTRQNIVPCSMTLNDGLTPGKLELCVPEAVFNENRVNKGDKVSFNVWRKGQQSYTQKFLGRVASVTDKYSQNPGLIVTCLDYRDFLSRDQVRRDYNVANYYNPSITDEPGGSKNVQDIISDIITSWKQRWQSLKPEYLDLIFDISGIPTTQPIGAVNVLGQPLNSVLEHLIEEYTNGQCLWVMDMSSGRPIMRVQHTDTQTTGLRNFYYGTDARQLISKQPAGLPNVNEINSSEDLESLETQIIVLGENVRVQTLLKLKPAWTFRENKQSYQIEGHYADAIPDPNPDKLSIPEIIALYLSKPTQFNRRTFAAQVTRIDNPDYNPDMASIGTKFRIQPHLMFDPTKGDDQAYVDAHENLNLVWQGAISVPDEAFQHMSYIVPRVESNLFTFPIPESEYNADSNNYGTGQENYPLFVLLRYRSDRVLIERTKFYKDIADVDTFDPVLFSPLKEGVALHKDDIVVSKPQAKLTNLMSFLLQFPSELALSSEDELAKIVDGKLIYEPCAIDASFEHVFDTTFGLIDVQLSWGDIVDTIDSIFGYTGSGTDETGDHFLRWFCTSPDYWDIDYSVTTPPRPLKKVRGMWYKMYKEIAFHGEHSDLEAIFVLDVANVQSVVDGAIVNTAREAAPDGFFWASLQELSRFVFYEFPDEVYLNAVVLDTRRVRLDTGDISPNAKLKRVGIYEDASFKKFVLKPRCLYDIDYRDEYEKLDILPEDFDKIAAFTNLPAPGVVTTEEYLNPADYPNGYIVRDDSSSVRQSSPPPGILHLNESEIGFSGSNDPAKSKMGRFASAKAGQTYTRVQKFTLTVDAMDFISKIGDTVKFNSGTAGDQRLRITQIDHQFYGGDIQSANSTTITVALMNPRG